ncbi:hypothetical protein J5N97_026778 [Dioscorea zingiberensis]|uniref:Serine-threonine/tyrosine-protein kinase catalytic domain-containing protein n=1 Tax=Dioscorea zingiberensis TaxID=325984 RepID=A0A9D5H731_9LILI|nr:hypothetical protein J5N97_026778 [Dioscorea zingiberensis]
MSAKSIFTSWKRDVIVICLSVVVVGIKIYSRYKHIIKRWENTYLAAATKTPFATIPDSKVENATVKNFINEIAREKPIRFTWQQLAGFTRNYATRLGSGGFGVVYKGEFANGIAVAVKVLNGDLGYKIAKEQFMAEMGTIGRTFHANIVRIYGFCFDSKHEIEERGENTDLAAATETPLATIKNSDIKNATVENFLNEIAREKPIRFTGQQLAGFTRDYATRLGSSGYGDIYKGEFPNGIAVAVKVLNGDLDYKSAEQQFIAEALCFIMIRWRVGNLFGTYGSDHFHIPASSYVKNSWQWNLVELETLMAKTKSKGASKGDASLSGTSPVIPPPRPPRPLKISSSTNPEQSQSQSQGAPTPPSPLPPLDTHTSGSSPDVPDNVPRGPDIFYERPPELFNARAAAASSSNSNAAQNDSTTRGKEPMLEEEVEEDDDDSDDY